MKKVISKIAFCVRILGLITSALGLVGCILAQKGGVFWKNNFEWFFTITCIGTYIVFISCFVEIFIRISFVNKSTLIRTTCLINGISIILIPIIISIFILKNTIAIQTSLFISCFGIIHLVNFLPKIGEKVVDVNTIFKEDVDLNSVQTKTFQNKNK